MPSARKWLPIGLGSVAVAIIGIRLVPYGHGHQNPPVRVEPAWGSLRTRALAVRACYDCHSNETVWRWHSNVAPISSVIRSHVEEGRSEISFSEWDRPQEEPGESAESVLEGEMPPWSEDSGPRSVTKVKAAKEWGASVGKTRKAMMMTTDGVSTWPWP
jgi:hypothetical protein